MWEQKQHLLPISATIVVFRNMYIIIAWQKFLVPGPSGWKKRKTRLSRKKSVFFDQLEYLASHQEGAQCQKFLQDPKIFDLQYFLHSSKKSCYRFGRLRWTLTLRNLKILILKKIKQKFYSNRLGFELCGNVLKIQAIILPVFVIAVGSWIISKMDIQNWIILLETKLDILSCSVERSEYGRGWQTFPSRTTNCFGTWSISLELEPKSLKWRHFGAKTGAI